MPKTEIISHDPRPDRMKSADDEVIVLSKNQIDPYSAKPSDFIVLREADELEVPGHGQCGKTLAQYKRLLKAAADCEGKSKPASGQLGE
jgi:hypothetical protein